MGDSAPPETILAGWYWHHHSQRPVYVYQGAHGWQARFSAGDPQPAGDVPPAAAENSDNIDLPLELYLQLVPLFQRVRIDADRRRTPSYPLVLPCQLCGQLTPSSFLPVGDGTWIARPRCDAHQDNR